MKPLGSRHGLLDNHGINCSCSCISEYTYSDRYQWPLYELRVPGNLNNRPVFPVVRGRLSHTLPIPFPTLTGRLALGVGD
ncbi:hypothetical protein BDN71DRAFT_1442579 [Pleurotus eryngii]|uniref:Uncharacterized protein n=1 Tax=Pleurotus eryngii TaxID=5323 RepID=A0A9P6A3R3_PLEER|nr:hypothetical protein BDN71DRAFT_1442579 [Pleurotus eryngii]